MTPEGRAGVGDIVHTPHGDYRVIVSVTGAGDLIESVVERAIALRAPNFMRHSITATCSLFGDTRGRERQTMARWKARQPPQERVVCGTSAK